MRTSKYYESGENSMEVIASAKLYARAFANYGIVFILFIYFVFLFFYTIILWPFVTANKFPSGEYTALVTPVMISEKSILNFVLNEILNY